MRQGGKLDGFARLSWEKVGDISAKEDLGPAAARRSDTQWHCLFDSKRRSYRRGLQERDTQEVHEATSALIQHCLGQDQIEDESYVTSSMGAYWGSHSLGIHQGKYPGLCTWWRSWQGVSKHRLSLPPLFFEERDLHGRFHSPGCSMVKTSGVPGFKDFLFSLRFVNIEEGERWIKMCSDTFLQDSCTVTPRGAMGAHGRSCREKAQGIESLPLGNKELLQGGSVSSGVREPGGKTRVPRQVGNVPSLICPGTYMPLPVSLQVAAPPKRRWLEL